MTLNPDLILEGLDAEQREAVTAIRGPVCVIAGAGTGKTRVITHRIAYAVASGVADPTKTLALTFTARAAGEMRARLRQLGVPSASARTFHSAALRQLMFFWPHSLGGQFPRLLTSKAPLLAASINATDTYLTQGAQTLRDISSEIEWAKSMEIAPHFYVEEATAASRMLMMPNGKSNKENLAEIAKVYEQYEATKKQERVIDFEDVLLLTVGMMEEDRAVRERVRDQYRYFTVDEYQDVSPLQQRLLNLWLGNREEICVVGDSAQTIYSFAGASSTFLLSFTQGFPQAKVVRLSRGYRSTPEIIRAANKVLRQGHVQQDTQHHELVSMNAPGEQFTLQSFNASMDEGREIAAKIDEIRNADKNLEIAILARTNSQLDVFENELAKRGIPSQVKNSDRFFDRVDVRDAMKVIRQASVLPSDDWYRDLESVLTPFGTADYVQAFLTLGRDLRANGTANLRQYLRELEDRAEQNNPPTLPGIVLSTLHAAKGLEWDHVFLVGINDGTLPLSTIRGAAEVEEERRLFYVGLTRAKKQVHLSYVGKPSPFLAAI
jgi:DNA helicase II / ATP-dependent DNA helicase PcrA